MHNISRTNITLAALVFLITLAGGLLLSTNLPVIIGAALVGGLVLLTAKRFQKNTPQN